MSALLLKVTARVATEISVLSAPPLPGGEIDDVPFVWYWTPTARTFYVASTHGWSTLPSHTPANTHIPAKFAGPFNFGRSLFSGLDPLSRGQVSLGTLDIADPTGELDSLVDVAWDGAEVAVLRGDPETDPAGWTTVADLRADSIEYDLERKTIALRDMGWQLAMAPLHDIRYAGTGGVEGDENWKGLLRPIVIGQVVNIPLRLLVSNRLIYEASCTSIYAVNAVRDGGGALTLDTSVGTGGNCASYAALDAATIASGKYATCLSLGLIRLGATPALQVTADVTGDADTIDGYGRPVTRGQIARRIATGRGKLKLLSSQIDDASFTALDTAQPGACGWYWDSEISKAEALNQVMQGCLGWWTIGLNAKLKVGYLDDVSSSTTGSLYVPVDGQALDGYRIIGLPRMQSAGAPRQATYLGYARNYTLQESFIGAASASARAVYSQPTLQVASVDTALQLARPTAPIVTIDSGFVSVADAQTECDRQQRVMGKRRERWQVDVACDAFLDPLGQAWSVREVNRFGFGSVRPLLAVGVSASTIGEDVATWDLWG